MHRKGNWTMAVLVVAALGVMFLAATGLASWANEDDSDFEVPSIDLEFEDEEMSTRKAALDLLAVVQAELDENVLADSTAPEWPVIADFIVNIFEGTKGEHFNEVYGLPSITYDRGVIEYVEELAGVPASDFAQAHMSDPDAAVDELLQNEPYAPETEALVRLVYVNNLLLNAEVDVDTLLAAGEQVNVTIALLQNHSSVVRN